jgi:hypothetical protein
MTVEITFGEHTITMRGELPYGECANMLAFLGDRACAIYRRPNGRPAAWVERFGLVAIWP